MDEVHDDGMEQDGGSDVVADRPIGAQLLSNPREYRVLINAAAPIWNTAEQRLEGVVIGEQFLTSGHFLRRFVAVHDHTPAAEQHVVFGGYTFEVVERNDILDTFVLKAIREHMG